jgi:hypothetical protein
MTRHLRIAVTGLAATYPFGGVFWDYLQYPLGLQRMSHHVLYIEDTGRWCYEPEAATFVEDGSKNAAYLSTAIERLEPRLAGCWFYRDATGRVFGKSWAEVVEFCRTADLFIHISASCWMRDEYFAAQRAAFIDTDPMYTQALIPDYFAGTLDEAARARVDMLRQHDVFFTFGENIGTKDCLIPEGVFKWIPTRQPVVLDCFDKLRVPVDSRRRVMTTVASWEPSEHSPVVNGVEYKGKSVEFERYMKLPRHSVLPLELAMSGRAPFDRLRSNGWRMIDAYRVSRDPWVYADYLANSTGEWSVAKNAYVASRSGWFSCRTACYLALGVPAVVQDTGFDRAIPGGRGIFPFNNLGQAASGIEEVSARPQMHAQAAREIAGEYFDSSRVLGDLIEHALN